MRITQNMITRNYLSSLNSNLGNLTGSNQKIASGRKFTKLSQNLSDGAKALRVREQLYKNEQALVNIRDAKNRLASAESNLMSVNDSLTTVEQKMIKGMDDTHKQERDILAKEIGNIKDEILQFANAQFEDKYLYAGTNNKEAPFSIGKTAPNEGRMMYNGIPVDEITFNNATSQYEDAAGNAIPYEGDLYIDIGLGLTLTGNQVDAKSAYKYSFSGLDIFGSDKETVQKEDGSNYTMSNNVYNLLDDIQKMMDPNTQPEYSDEEMGLMLEKLKDKTQDLMLNVTDIGNRSKFLEKTEERLDSDIINLKETRNSLETVNDAEESMNAKMFEYAWLATLKMGAKILPPSLLDYIS